MTKFPSRPRKPGPNLDLRSKCAMDGALVRNLQNSPALFLSEHAPQLHLAVDVVEQSVWRFALLAVNSVNPRMTEPYGYGLEGPLLAPRRTSPSSSTCRIPAPREENRMGWGRYRSRRRRWAVAHEPMPSRCDLLCETGCSAVDVTVPPSATSPRIDIVYVALASTSFTYSSCSTVAILAQPLRYRRFRP